MVGFVFVVTDVSLCERGEATGNAGKEVQTSGLMGDSFGEIDAPGETLLHCVKHGTCRNGGIVIVAAASRPVVHA